jgi:hypothetical protein
LEEAIWVAFFAETTGVIRNEEFPSVKLFEETATIFEQGLA